MLVAFEDLLRILKEFPTKALAAKKLDEILQNLVSLYPAITQGEFYMKGLLELGNLYFHSAQFKSVLKCYDSLKAIYDKVGLIPFQQYGILYLNKGLCYMYSGNYSVAEENFKRALLCNEDIVGDKSHTQLKGHVYQNLGCLYELSNSLEDARDSYEKALKIK